MSRLGNVATSSGEQQLSRLPGSRGGRTQKVRVAYQVRSRFLSPRADIDATGRGDAVARQVHQRWVEAMAEAKVWYRLRAPFWAPAVQLGTISTLRSVDVETGNFPREVFFTSLEDCRELDVAFHRPEILEGVEVFAEQYPDVITGSMSTKMVVVVPKLRKGFALGVVTSALLVSIVAGLVVGLVTSSAQVGFACFGGFGVIISLLLAVMIQMSK